MILSRGLIPDHNCGVRDAEKIAVNMKDKLSQCYISVSVYREGDLFYVVFFLLLSKSVYFCVIEKKFIPSLAFIIRGNVDVHLADL